LVFLLLATLTAPVAAADYNLGVSVGTYVVYGHWEAIGANTSARMSWQKIESIGVSGKEVTLRMTGQLKNGTAMPQNGDTYLCNVETGATNFTHDVMGFVIPANLNEGDRVLVGSNNFTLETTDIRTYIAVSRFVNVFTEEISGVDNQGPYTSRLTRVYDKASGMLLESQTWTKWPNTSTEWVIYYVVTDTNIFSTQTTSAGLPMEYVYPLVALVVVALSASGVTMFRRRKQPEAETKMLEAKVMDLTYNLSGVNRGECYLADSMERCVKVICDLHSRGIRAMAVVREDPSVLSKTCNLQPEDVVLLSVHPLKGFQAISSLQEVSIAIAKFLKSGGGAVLLDGFEYLVSRFGFNAVYMCLQEKHIEFLEAGAVLLVPVNMETLDSREKGQLLSELRLL